MKTKVCFADLTHMGQMVAANTFPLGISMLAGYALQELGEEIKFEIFKYPDDLNDYLRKNKPRIACFSCFTWNLNIGCEFAKRIKEESPETIILFGGPHFPSGNDEQKEFLEYYSIIDFYIEFEGERTFVEFFNEMKKLDFDGNRFKHERRLTPNLRYLDKGEFVCADLIPKISDLNEIPSPHLTGLMDKFHDGVLIPLLQTTRGCPYRCSFCWEGGDYFAKTKRFDQERIEKEVVYIAERTKVPDLGLTDSNFGSFKKDIDTAKAIKRCQEKFNRPTSIILATSKNNKERTKELVEILDTTMPPNSAVQSTDEEVLKILKRKNAPLELIADLAKITNERGGQSEGEVILCLPGDTKAKHFKTVYDMLDAGISFLRIYQFMMLPGTESASRESYKEFEYITKFRVLPRCFGTYQYGDEHFPSGEVEEICVGHKTMPHEDYQACRDLSLTVEIFNNDSLFFDLIQFLNLFKIKRSTFIDNVHHKIVNGTGNVSNLYYQYREEELRNLWETREEVEKFLKQDGVIQRYVDGEFGTNELYKYRVLAVFENLEEIHDIAFSTATEFLSQKGIGEECYQLYLDELKDFSLVRKSDPLNVESTTEKTYHFDFVKQFDKKFSIDPADLYKPEGIKHQMFHTPHQTSLITDYLNQYGTDVIGLGRILIRANMNRLYRSVSSNGRIGAIDSVSLATEQV